MAANIPKRDNRRSLLGPGYKIWMAVGVFLLYYSTAIGIGILILLAVRLFFRSRAEQKKAAVVSETGLRPAVAALFEGAVYEPDHGFSRETIFELGLLHRTRRFQSRHRIVGRSRGIPFEAAAVTLSEQKQMFGPNSGAVLFEGFFIAVDRPSEDCGTVRVLPVAYPKALPQTAQEAKPGPVKQAAALRVYPVPVSHAGFAQRFRVFAQNPEQAAALFSDRFCNNVIHVAERCAAPVVLCFQRDRLYIGVELEQPVPFDKPAGSGEETLQKQAVMDNLQLVSDCIGLMIAPEAGVPE